VIDGDTEIIAHVGYPTHTFRSPTIYNPWFERHHVNALVVPMGVRAEDFTEFFRSLFKITNVRGALITMPHKISTMSLVDEVSPAAAVAGATNAVVVRQDGTLLADQFDGTGFVRSLIGKGFEPTGKRALVLGNGGVGSAIAASLAAAGIAEIGLSDVSEHASHQLGERIIEHFPEIVASVVSTDPDDYDLVVNATPAGMKHDDPLPVDVARIRRGAFVADVVLAPDKTPFLQAAETRGCVVQTGSEMLAAMVPACLEFFGFTLDVDVPAST
jgi:shikimate dehydrogenase